MDVHLFHEPSVSPSAFSPFTAGEHPSTHCLHALLLPEHLQGLADGAEPRGQVPHHTEPGQRAGPAAEVHSRHRRHSPNPFLLTPPPSTVQGPTLPSHSTFLGPRGTGKSRDLAQMPLRLQKAPRGTDAPRRSTAVTPGWAKETGIHTGWPHAQTTPDRPVSPH